MASQDYQIVLDGQWVGGVDSFLYPTDLAQGSYAWLVNGINRGGIVQTRPGKRRIKSFSGRLLQGMHWCRTIDDRNYQLIAVDGNVYYAEYPFKDYTQVTGITLSATAEMIWFETGLQATVYDNLGNLQLLSDGPHNIVCMQDGLNQPCFWDAMSFKSGIINAASIPGKPPSLSPMPVGTAMLWKDNRMWVAQNELVLASDLLYPQLFSDETALATQSGFRFPRKVVQLWPNPVQDVLVFTDSSMHTLKSSIQDRTQWQTTEGFQSDVNLEVGLVAPRCIANLHGMPWFLTARGLISYDRALTTNLSTVILTVDGEMQRSKHLLSPDLTVACMGAWENILLVGMPASSLYNRHTWVMDAGIAQKLTVQSPMCWTGIWTGTFPAIFNSPIVKGTQHNYELSYSGGYLALSEGESPSPMVDDAPGQAYIHLWENFVPNQIDACEPEINCSLETRAFTLATDDYYRFAFAEFMIINLKGVVPVQVYVTGLAGNYQKLFATTLRADIGPWGNPTLEGPIYYVAEGQTTTFENYRRQVRHMRTTDWVINAPNNISDGAACIEIGRPDGIDKAFQLMIQWQGRMGIRSIKFFYDRSLQSPVGVCPTDESTTPHVTLEATF